MVSWVEWRGKPLDRPGKPKRVVRVNWERLEEAQVQEAFNSHLRRSFSGIPRVREQWSVRWAGEAEQRVSVPTLTCGHEGWVMTQRTRSRIQAAEMGFLHRVAGVSLRDKVRSSVIREGLEVEPLQLRWFGHLVRMPPGRLSREVFQARPAGRRPRGRPRTRWRGYISSLAWERLGTPQSELVDEGKGTFGALCWN